MLILNIELLKISPSKKNKNRHDATFLMYFFLQNT